MIRVRVTSNLRDMGTSYLDKPGRLVTGATRVAADAARDGNDTAKRIARFRYGRGHARKYAGTMSAARTGEARYEFGPVARGQGILAPILERGTRNNPAHHNLDQAADLMAPGFHRSVDSMLDGIFGDG